MQLFKLTARRVVYKDSKALPSSHQKKGHEKPALIFRVFFLSSAFGMSDYGNTYASLIHDKCDIICQHMPDTWWMFACANKRTGPCGSLTRLSAELRKISPLVFLFLCILNRLESPISPTFCPDMTEILYTMARCIEVGIFLKNALFLSQEAYDSFLKMLCTVQKTRCSPRRFQLNWNV